MKKIICLLSNKDNSDDIISSVFKEEKWDVIYVNDVLREIAKEMNVNAEDDKSINDLYERGNKISKLYWVNIAIMRKKSNLNNVLVVVEAQERVPNLMCISVKDVAGCTKILGQTPEELSASIREVLKRA